MRISDWSSDVCSSDLDPLALAQAFGCAVWEEQRDIADAATCAAIVQETGHNSALLDRATDPELATRHAPLTDEALSRGVFGAPSYLYRAAIFWGQDRPDFLDRQLGQSSIGRASGWGRGW